ncbi:hypothetical protein HF521_008216 [Silurus meridionalis]|uniref:Uncharacterized protein n=1 Tax=Silurus meridionalis TaxID=175797 RepID=A0A8T0AQW6_SILME|nr:hypothetical protein HF521_008216 [Silurus meridionalis]
MLRTTVATSTNSGRKSTGSTKQPGRNVTMSISNLTVEDGGVCERQGKKQSSSQESFPFIPITVGTAIILQIVALVYCTTQKKMLVGFSTAQLMEMEV